MIDDAAEREQPVNPEREREGQGVAGMFAQVLAQQGHGRGAGAFGGEGHDLGVDALPRGSAGGEAPAAPGRGDAVAGAAMLRQGAGVQAVGKAEAGVELQRRLALLQHIRISGQERVQGRHIGVRGRLGGGGEALAEAIADHAWRSCVALPGGSWGGAGACVQRALPASCAMWARPRHRIHSSRSRCQPRRQ